MELLTRQHCPACGASGGDVVLSLPYDTGVVADHLRRTYGDRLDTAALAGRRFELIDCRNCGTIRQRLVPDEAYLRHLYGSAALEDQQVTAAGRDLGVRRSWAEQVERAVVHFGGQPEQVRVLDHGAGPGAWLQMAAAFGCRTAALEFSEPARQALAAAGHEVFAPGELPERRFHMVNSEQVLEHLIDPLGAVREIARALRPGGILRVCVPNGTDIRDRLNRPDWDAPKGSPRSLNPVAPLEHLNCFDRRGLDTLAERAGLEPFDYPLRETMRSSSRIRTVLGAVRHRVRRPAGTLQLYRRPG